MNCPARGKRSAPAGAVVAVVLVTVLALAGCKTIQPTDLVSGATGAAASTDPGSRRLTDSWGERYRASPKDPEAAIQYAQALRGNDRRSQAVAVLEQASIQNPRHPGVLGAYGRALADVGHYERALDVLNRVHTPNEPNWRILSVQGAVLDQMGRHEEAQRYYATALRIAPDEPSVLSNLGLSYALSKDLVRAESTLRRAVGQAQVNPRVRQNLALVVGLQGRFTEAAGIARADLPSDEAPANVAYLRQMLAQQNGWKQLDKSMVKAQGS